VKGRLGWATGLVVFGWLVLALVRAWQVGASPSQVAPYLYAPLLIVLGGWLGWWAGHRLEPQTVARIVIVAVGYVALTALLTNHPGRGATGYANANAALAVQLTAVGGLIALRHATQWIGLAAVGIGALAIAANGSQGGAATGVIVLIVAVVAVFHRSGHRRWPMVVLSLGICTSAVAVLVALARRTIWPDWALSALSRVRHDMWNAGWAAFRRAEAFGYGPGGYAQANPWARDADTMSAHSLPIQVAAELGGVGLVLLTLLFLWGLAWATLAYSARATWIAIAAWTALSAHAFMDHLLEFWPVPLAAGLVLGYGLVAESDPEPEHEVV